MRIQKDKTKVELFLENKKVTEHTLIELRNGERLKPSSITKIPDTEYGLCYAIMFDTYSRYMLYTKHGRKSNNRETSHDIVEVIAE